MYAIYLRKSRHDETADTLAPHRIVLTEMCQKNDWEYEIFEEITSSVNTKDELEKIKANIDKYKGIICMDIDRLSRDELEGIEIKLLLIEKGLKVFTPSGTFDPSKEGMLYSIRVMFANEEYRKTKKRLSDGKRNKFKEGMYSIGKPPFGYRIGDNKLLEIVEEEAEIVRQIFQLCLEGLGSVSIGDNVGLHRSNIKNILEHTAYIGQITATINDETLTQSCPSIVDLETFVACQEEIKRRDRNPKRVKKEVRSFLQGLVRCEECGNQMIVASTRTGAVLKCHLRGCPTSATKLDFVEQMILTELETSADVLSGVLEERLNQTVPSNLGEEITAIVGQIESLNAKMERTVELYTDGDIPKANYTERKIAIESEINELTLKRKSLELQSMRDNSRAHVEEIQTVLRDVEEFEFKELTEQHLIAGRLIDKIVYSRVLPKGIATKKATETHPPKMVIEWSYS